MKLAPYKKEQARITRISAFAACLLLDFWACSNLYGVLDAKHSWYEPIQQVDIFGLVLELTPMLIACVGAFLVIGFGFYLALNSAKVSEFLIETEGELKKVSWPERREFLGASVAVLVVVVFLVLYIYVVDLGLTFVLTRLKIGY